MPMDWEDLVTQIDAQLPKEVWAQTLIGVGVLVLTALFVQWVVARVVLLLAHRLLVLTGHEDWDKALQRRRAYQNLWYAVPFAVVSMGIDLVPHVDRAAEIVGRLAHAGAWICVFVALSGVLSAWQDTYSATTRAQTRSIKGYIQIGKLVLMAICTVLVLSILIDRSPLWMISGLGALSAVLLLVFKDTLLSLVASTQLTSNDMLRIGDWIEMPQSNADGFVRTSPCTRSRCRTGTTPSPRCRPTSCSPRATAITATCSSRAGAASSARCASMPPACVS